MRLATGILEFLMIPEGGLTCNLDMQRIEHPMSEFETFEALASTWDK